MPDSDTIIAAIRDRYERDPAIPHPGEIAISERAGTVTLRGTVASLHQRGAAVHIAGNVRGVRSVSDELLLDPRDRYEDAEIRGAALRELNSRDDVPDDRIEVKVADAWLTLSGVVKHQADSNAAFDAVSPLPGIGGITNEIKVVAAGQP